MPDVEAAIKRGDPDSAASLGERMYTRHGPYAIWAELWWSTVVKAVSATANQASQGSLVDTAMAHISAVDRGGLDPTVSAWLDTLQPAAKVELLGQRSSPFLHIFLRMITTRRLSSLTLLDKLVYPIWLSTATACLSTRLRQSSRVQAAVENTVMLAHQVLVTIGPHKHLPPSNLEEALVLQTARARVFHDTHVPSLIRHLPYLVVLQYSPAIWPKTHTQIGELLDSLAATAEFKTAAFRHLDLLKDAFLSSEWSKPSLESGLETGMVDTLKMIMSEHAGTNTCSHRTSSNDSKLTKQATLSPRRRYFLLTRWLVSVPGGGQVLYLALGSSSKRSQEGSKLAIGRPKQKKH
jgi:mediator of RNA polymerase II transcription subunit 12